MLEHVLWSGYICCPRYEKGAIKGTSKVQYGWYLKLRTPEFQTLSWEGGVDDLCITRSIRRGKDDCTVCFFFEKTKVSVLDFICNLLFCSSVSLTFWPTSKMISVSSDLFARILMRLGL